MRIGIDCRTILNPENGEKAGVGHYTYQLVFNLIANHSEDEFFLFFGRGAERVAEDLKKENAKIIYFPFPRLKRFLPFFYNHLLVGKWLQKFNLDVFHAPAHTYPLSYNGRVVVTVHDLAIYKYPEFFPTQKISTKFLVPKALHNALHIIAVSESTKKDIIEIFSISENKISVIYLGFDTSLFSNFKDLDSNNSLESLNIKKPYILSVGTLQPRKNYVGLIKAYKIFKNLFLQNFDKFNLPKLVIVGNVGWMYEPIYQEAKNQDLLNDVIFTGYVGIKDLPLVYKNSSGFVFPSFYEGFGLPLLEAIASDIPIVSSNTSSLPEVGGNVPLYVDPLNLEQIAQGLFEIVTNKSEIRRQADLSKKQAEKFSWVAMSDETFDVYLKHLS